MYLVNDVARSRAYRILEPQFLERILVSPSIKLHCSAWALALFVTERWFWTWKVVQQQQQQKTPPPISGNYRRYLSPESKNRVLIVL